MQKNMKRLLSLLLTVILVLTNTQFTAYGAQQEETSSEIIPEGVVLNYREAETVDSSFVNESRDTLPVRGELPVSYSASSNIPDSIVVEKKDDHVSPVKNQNPYGTCWAHSGISIAESSYIINQGLPSDAVDYNEYHLVHYAYGAAKDTLDLFGGGYNANGGNLDVLDQGGNNLVSLCLFASWQGVSDASQDTYGATQIENGVTPESILGYSDAAHMENGYVLTMPDMESENYKVDMDIIKQMVMEYGSVSMSYYAADASQ